MKTKTQIGIDSTGTWTPRQYAIDAGWGFESIEATAQLGVADADAEGLTNDQQERLLEYCKERMRDLIPDDDDCPLDCMARLKA